MCSPCRDTSETSTEDPAGDSVHVVDVQDRKRENAESRSGGEGSASSQNLTNSVGDYSLPQAQSSRAMSGAGDGHALSSAGDAGIAKRCFNDGKECPATTARSQGSSESASGEDFRASKKQVSAELLERTEVLRKLNMVKTYRSKVSI